MRAATLANAGQIQFSGGPTQVQAGFTNHAGALVIVSGAANATFSGAAKFQSGSEPRVSEGAVATFFGAITERNGALFTGICSKHVEGGPSVGASPRPAQVAGSVVFGTGNACAAGRAGLAAGTQFDKCIVCGWLTLRGTLELVDLPGFQAHAGGRIELFDRGQASGRFEAIDTSRATLGNGLRWDSAQLYLNGEVGVNAVPEPVPVVLWLTGLAALAIQRRRAASRSS